MLEVIETAVHSIAEIGELILELCGVGVLLYSGAKAFYHWAWESHASGGIHMGEGISMTLEFLLAAEVLHTMNAHEPKDLIFLAAMVAIRAAMTLEIHLELKSEKAAERLEAEERRKEIERREKEKAEKEAEIRKLWE